MRELCEVAFARVGLIYEDYVVQDHCFFRHAEVDLVVGNPEKASRVLGWTPTVTFQKLIQTMIESDLEILIDGQNR